MPLCCHVNLHVHSKGRNQLSSMGPSSSYYCPGLGIEESSLVGAIPRHPNLTQLRSESPQREYKCTPQQFRCCCFLLLLFVWCVFPVCSPLYPESTAFIMGPSSSIDHSVQPMAASFLENGLPQSSLIRPHSQVRLSAA